MFEGDEQPVKFAWECAAVIVEVYICVIRFLLDDLS